MDTPAEVSEASGSVSLAAVENLHRVCQRTAESHWKDPCQRSWSLRCQFEEESLFQTQCDGLAAPRMY